MEHTTKGVAVNDAGITSQETVNTTRQMRPRSFSIASRISFNGSARKRHWLNPTGSLSRRDAALEEQVPHSNDYVELVALALTLLLSPLAAATLVIRVAVYGDLSFHTAALLQTGLMLVLAMGTLAFAVTRQHSLHSLVRVADKKVLVWGVVACMLGALAATCLHRPDADDVIYLPKVLYLLAHPQTRMDGLIPELTHNPVLSLPKAAATYYPTSYEFLQAVIAHATGTDFLTIYYVLAPCAAAVLGVLFIILNLKLLGQPTRTAAICAALLVPLVLLTGESHRSLGNFTLIRLYQSKCVFIFTGIQAFVAISLLFFKAPSAPRWIALLVVVLAIVGVTTTALVMLPLLAVPLFVSWWCTESHHRVKAMGIAYGLALLPVVAFALDYRRYALERTGFGSELNSGFPNTFMGQIELVTGGMSLPPTSVAFALAVGVCLYTWRTRRHAFLLLWTAITIALYLNPWSAPGIMRFVTTENVYWRLFYLLPIPLMLGMAIGYGVDRVEPDSKAGRLLPWLALLVLGAAVAVMPTSVTRTGNGVRIAPPGLTLDAYAADASACLRFARPGAMLAPISLAQDMALLSADHTQVVTRADFMRNALFKDQDEFNRRERAARFIAGAGDFAQDFADVLQREQPDTVITASSARVAAAPYLASAHYHQVAAVGQWLVFDRAATP
ncbi:hypothetical protein [Dyella sp. EPa41]|uniref:hypothetical protein n=1 Tax=Dyella sp. EPa41 TaxID=1561194 RepID=UPI001915793F|nr:hypothetical protein [Dyella sp. EPa41]